MKTDQHGGDNGGASGGAVLFLFGALWCVFLAFMDIELGGKVWRQLRTIGYEAAEATILESEVVRQGTRKGKYTHGIKVRYQYKVGNEILESDQYAHQAVKSSDSKWAHEAAAQNPVGAKRTCYVNPEDRSDAVLRRGVDGSDVVTVMFLTPFHAIGLGLISGAISAVYRAVRWPPAVRRKAGRLEDRIYVGDWGAWTAFLCVAGFGSFIAIFLIVIPFGFHPPLKAVGATYAAVLAWASWVAIGAWLKKRDGVYDIVIDWNAGSLSIPAMHGRKQREEVPAQSVERVEAKRVYKEGKGNRRGGHETQVLLVTRSGAEMVLLKPWSTKEGNRWAQWLGTTLGLPSPAEGLGVETVRV